jgi:hypothetical protein
MDAIFKKSSNIFDVVGISIKEPYRYDKHGQLKPEYLEEAIRRESVRRESVIHEDSNEKFDSDESANDKPAAIGYEGK